MNNSSPWVFISIGSFIGGLIPFLWGNGNGFSFASIIWSSIGGFIGLWIHFKTRN